MKVDILAIGSELLYGDIVNGNAAWLGQRLSEIGAVVKNSAVVGDDVSDIAEAIQAAMVRSEALIITGGLGPTQDDLTREGLALAAGVALKRDPEIEEALFSRFRRLRRDVPEMNFRQADVPEGAWTIPNGNGSAPGLGMEALGGLIFCLPGVPHEMMPMVIESVLPLLVARDPEPAVVLHRIIRTSGMWESAVAEAMAPEVDRLEAAGNPVIAFLASGGMTRVKITARATTAEAAEALAAPVERFALAALGPAVFGIDDDTLEKTLLSLLIDRGETVATAESLTGGLLSARLVGTPGFSSVIKGGLVTYAPDLKRALLGVGDQVIEAHGVVSAACVAAMAQGARERCDSTYALAVTGVAGPDELEGHPVGTVFIGLAHPDGCETRLLKLPGDRERIRDYSCVAAIDLLRRFLLDPDDVVGSEG